MELDWEDFIELVLLNEWMLTTIFIIGGLLLKAYKKPYRDRTLLTPGTRDEIEASQRERLLAPFHRLGASTTRPHFAVPDEPGLEVHLESLEGQSYSPSGDLRDNIWYMAVFYFQLHELADGVSLSTHKRGEEYRPAPLQTRPPIVPRPSHMFVRDVTTSGEVLIESSLAHALDLILSPDAPISAASCASSMIEHDACQLIELHRYSDQLILVYQGEDALSMPAVLTHARSLRRTLSGWTDESTLLERASKLFGTSNQEPTRALCAQIIQAHTLRSATT